MSIDGSFVKAALSVLWITGALLSVTSIQAGPSEPYQTPLFVSQSVPPLVMLVLGKDHSLFFEAYNDVSDLDGDGRLDLQFDPSISYYGLFDSSLCYTHTGGAATDALFRPADEAGANNTCTGKAGRWSGNWLNYITTSRVDALRKVLYGGHRDVDTAAQTILRRAYIPQDGHSWAKEYTSTSGYDITQYTPLNQPDTGKRHFFGNLTRNYGTNCVDLDKCSDLAPVLSVVTNSSNRVWQWASSERPVLAASGSTLGGGTRTDYTVRVEVCTASFHANDCQAYGSGYKPVGLLQQYTDNSMLFGLLTGSYDQNMSGGVLRKVVSAFSNEVNSSDGTFTANNTIVDTLNKLRIRGYQNGNTTGNYGTPSRTRIMNQGEFVDWGNPIGEMMYETLRYFAGRGGATTAFTTSSTHDTAVRLGRATWDNPYGSRSAAQAQRCAKPNMLVMSNINTSYDSDQLPGSHFPIVTGSGNPVTNDLSGLDVSAQANAITTAEGGIANNPFFIGQSGTSSDFAPTAKTVTSLAQIRGLAPEEPTKQGSYYPASVARYGAKTVVNSAGEKETDTYVVALASPLPSFDFNVGGKTISLVPFAKTTAGNSTNNSKGNYQPTNPIVDLYVESYSTAGTVFRINYEIDEQGNDFDSDMIVKYEITVSGNQLVVKVTPESSSTGGQQHAGYVISGSNRDGVYLVVQDKRACATSPYFLNVPPGRSAGYCDVSPMPSDCSPLPYVYNNSCSNGGTGSGTISTQTFNPGKTAAASLLRSPLWYAAKYGIAGRDPSAIEGDPDNYFLVTNASTLKDQLTNAFNDIMQRNNSVTSPAVKPTTPQTADADFFVYRTDYDVETWSGDLIKETIDPNTGNRTSHWRAALGSRSGRTIKMADVAGKALVPLSWDNIRARGVNGIYSGVNLQQALATDPQGTDTPKVDAEGRLTVSADIARGQGHLDFVKGTNTSYRDRKSLLGDIINSSPVVVEGAQYLHYLAEAIEPGSNYAAFAETVKTRSTPLVFVGANDGMLHAFDTETGAEKFAFVPSAVIPNLNKLTSSDYNEAGGEHQFFVDGTPVVRDVYFDNQWHTVLVGTLRAGGKSIFALDITDPDDIRLLWELTEGDDLQDEETQSDVGYSFPVPTIARLHNGKWAVVTGNGYDSARGRAVLFLIDIKTGELTKIPTKDSDSLNGLSSVRVADDNSDGVADYVYAGDLKGNLWRFDLDPTGSKQDSAYTVSFGGSPLFAAKDGTGSSANTQAITAPPSVVRHPSMQGYILMFGTGRYFQLTDKETDKLDSLYGIWDRETKGASPNSTPSLSRDNLQQQTFITETSSTWNSGTSSQTTQNIRVLSNNSITWAQSSTDTNSERKFGWYLDLKVGNELKGERITDEMAARGQVLFFTTRTPSNDPCEAGLEGWTYGINPYTGGVTRFNVFDFDKNTMVNSGDSYNFNGTATVISGFKTPAGGISLSNNTLFTTDGSAVTVDFDPGAPGRQSWQIIPEDD